LQCVLKGHGLVGRNREQDRDLLACKGAANLLELGYSASQQDEIGTARRDAAADVAQFVGRGLTLLNLSTMGGVFIVQAATGAVVGLFDAPDGVYPLDAYRAAFGCIAAVLTVCTLIYLRSHDPAREAATHNP
jgi:hypothetical protein